jgi:acetylornithine deacetylase/succinyl-diaminopimelate desuccinylase-like protein
MLQTQHQSDLFQLLRIPSISTLPDHKADIRKTVDWLRAYLNQIGITDLQELYAAGMTWESNHPVLFAQKISNPELPTLLIYGHYDVQPVDPVSSWLSAPFEPEIRDGFIYGRGATDDKGQLFTHLAALKELSEEWGEQWPLNIKILIEGEEEMGGENIAALFAQPEMQELFKADYGVLSDTEFLSAEQPALEYGLRGIAYMQIDVKLADFDLHSGLFGGGVRNPANALAYILTNLYDSETGKILIPGFYDDVIDIDAAERANLVSIPHDGAEFLKQAGNAKAPFGESGYSTIERTSARPTLDINGIWGGFMGEGAKTIIPATAHAKVSMRLVANQDPQKVAKLFADYVHEIAPSGVEVSVIEIHGGDGALIDRNSPAMQAAAKSLEMVFGKQPVFTRSGGSIPVVALVKKHLKIDPVMMGYGLPGDGLHSPNERFSLSQFENGIGCNKQFYRALTQL